MSDINIQRGINALQCVIASLRDTAHFSDEEGELTHELRELRDWVCARAAIEAQRVPDGWKLVPVELTDEMRNAAKPFCTVSLLWKALLSSAPPVAQPAERKPLSGEKCKTCDGAGGFEAAASSTNYYWQKCPDCHGIGD